MYSKSDNIEFTSYNDAKESVHGLFDSLRSRYQGNLETSMREREREQFYFEFSSAVVL